MPRYKKYKIPILDKICKVTNNINTVTTYTYTITTNGSCTNQSETGTITVNPDDELILNTSNNNQTICETGTNNLDPINYSIGTMLRDKQISERRPFTTFNVSCVLQIY